MCMCAPNPCQAAYAAEVYEKLEDSKSLVGLYIETQQWQLVSPDHMTP